MLKQLKTLKSEMVTMSYFHYLSWQILLFLFIYLTMMALSPDEALPPNGSLYHLYVLLILSHIGGKIMDMVKLPSLFGMLVAGMIYGNLAKPELDENLSSGIRSIALLIILLRAGLHLSPEYIRKLSFACIRVTAIPFMAETLAAALFSYWLFEFDFLWALMIGFVLAAVSPAVVVPCMIRIQQAKLSEGKGIPTLNIAAASIDDVLAVTGFNICLGFALPLHQTSLAWSLMKGPLEVLVGLGFGILMGVALWYAPERYDEPEQDDKYNLSRFALLLMAGSFAMFGSKYFDFEGAGPLALLVMSFVASIRWRQNEWEEKCEESLKIIWLVFKRFLFSLIGAQLLIDELEMNTVLLSSAMILIGIVVKVFIAYLVTYGINLDRKERLFVAISWLPKATVQAAIGAVALDMARTEEEVRQGKIILTSAAISIILTAPLGAIIMDRVCGVLLQKPNKQPNQVDLNNNNNTNHTSHVVCIHNNIIDSSTQTIGGKAMVRQVMEPVDL